eukprot:scaffold39363_cov298-Amphora_coffeaeformis.AAC.1
MQVSDVNPCKDDNLEPSNSNDDDNDENHDRNNSDPYAAATTALATTTTTSPNVSVLRQRWVVRAMENIFWGTVLACSLDVLSGVYWAWGLNMVALGFWNILQKLQQRTARQNNWDEEEEEHEDVNDLNLFSYCYHNVGERETVVAGAACCFVTASLQTAAGILRLTSDYDGFWHCGPAPNHHTYQPDFDYQGYDKCNAIWAYISLAAAVIWSMLALLWIWIMSRVFRETVWTRTNPLVPIRFLAFASLVAEILGFGYAGWLSNLFCILVLESLVDRRQRGWFGRILCCKNATNNQYLLYGLAAILALVSAFLQGGLALQQTFRDERRHFYCDNFINPLRHNNSDGGRRLSFNCPDDLRFLCLAGACVWCIVSILCLRQACLRCCEKEQDNDDGSHDYEIAMLSDGQAVANQNNRQELEYGLLDAAPSLPENEIID